MLSGEQATCGLAVKRRVGQPYTQDRRERPVVALTVLLYQGPMSSSVSQRCNEDKNMEEMEERLKSGRKDEG